MNAESIARWLAVAVLVSLWFAGTGPALAEVGPAAPIRSAESNWNGKPPKNVLFIVLDATSAKHLAAWGYSRKTTPIIDEFADSGMRFLNAYSQASSTLPSTASFMTGMPAPFVPEKQFYLWIRDSDYTLSQAFRAAGFATGGFSENAWIAEEFGFSQGFERFKRFESKVDKASGLEPYISSKRTIDAAIRWFSPIKRRPWFCYVHLLRPHFPFNAPDEFKKAFSLDGPTEISRSTQVSRLSRRKKHAMQMAIRHYDGNLRFADHLVGEILAVLKKRRLLEKTLVIIASDHGEAFGEHGTKGHNLEVFEELIHVPLVIRAPASSKFKTGESRTVVEMMDIFPTLVELYDLEVQQPLAGQSLLPLLTGTPGYSKEYSVAATTGLDRISVRKGTLKAIFSVDAAREIVTPRFVFELTSDPHEQKNLLLVGGVPEDLQRVADQHLAWVRARGNLGTEPTSISEQQIDELKAIGYLQ